MAALTWNDWAFIAVVGIITLVSLAEVIEGWNDDDRGFASLKFKSQIEQRICRILLTVACPAIYIIIAIDYIFRRDFALENIGAAIICGIILLSWRYIVMILMYIILYFFLSLIHLLKALFSKETWIRFKNWLWNANPRRL